jgi:hypothetical protein
MAAYYYEMNCDIIFCRCPLCPWQQSLVSISSRVAHLLCWLHLGVAQWIQQHMDGCSEDSIQSSPSFK